MLKKKLTLEECVERYNFYSGKYCDAYTSHETKQAEHYLTKLFDIIDYARLELGVDINDHLNDIF